MNCSRINTLQNWTPPIPASDAFPVDWDVDEKKSLNDAFCAVCAAFSLAL